MMMMGHRFFSRVTNNHTRSLIGTTIYVTSANRKSSSKWQRWCVYYGMEQVFHPNIMFPNKRNVPLPVGMRSDGAIKYYTLLLLNAGKYGAMCREMLKKKKCWPKKQTSNSSRPEYTVYELRYKNVFLLHSFGFSHSLLYTYLWMTMGRSANKIVIQCVLRFFFIQLVLNRGLCKLYR